MHLSRKRRPPSSLSERPIDLPRGLVTDLRKLIECARLRTALAVNAELVMLYWQVGKRIRRDVLQNQRAEYGKQIVEAVSRQLTLAYGRGFDRANLFHMLRFAEVFEEEQIVYALSRQLSWTHLRHIIYMESSVQREFYIEMCRLERWSTRELKSRIDSMLFERTAISRKPQDHIVREIESLKLTDKLAPDLIFRDPYILDFLGLQGEYSEKDLEAAIIRELERFILELGTDFAFVARQKRMTVDNEDYYLDLLFYHRRLRRLIAIDLKLGKFQAVDKGQMELYLRWLEAHEQLADEETPIGLILCAGKSEEHVALLRLHESGIRVAQYMTELPPQELLESKFHEAIETARARLRQSPDHNRPSALPR